MLARNGEKERKNTSILLTVQYNYSDWIVTRLRLLTITVLDDVEISAALKGWEIYLLNKTYVQSASEVRFLTDEFAL